MVNFVEIANSIEEIDIFKDNNKLALLYVSSNNCSVCTVLFPKIQELLKKYPNIASKKVIVDNLPEIAGHLSIFTIPALIIYIEGKESIRKARFISIEELDREIERYYDLFY